MRYLPILIALSLSACGGVVNPGDMKQAEGLCADHQGVNWVEGHAAAVAKTLHIMCSDEFYLEVSRGGKHE